MKFNEVKEKSVADLGIEYNGGDFDCTSNSLTSLEGSPEEVSGDFYCYGNLLTSLKGAPQKVGGYFDCSNNSLTSLEGGPQEIGYDFYCINNKLLTSLKDIHKHIKSIKGEFDAEYCPKIKSNVLGLLLIKNLKQVKLNNKEVQVIINMHLDGGSMRSALECQAELIQAGFEEYAKL